MSTQYRVQWFRQGWSPTTKPKGRVFTSYAQAREFIDHLQAGGRPDLSPLSFIRLDARPFQRWQCKWEMPARSIHE